jgi:hypothetical protein
LELERIARHRKVPFSTVVDTAVREWRAKNAVGLADDEEQKRLHAAAARYIGAIESGNARGSETVRETMRKRLSRRYGSR